MKTAKDIFYFVNDVMVIFGCSRSMAYKIIRNLNAQLKEKGWEVYDGRVSKSWFHERYYCIPASAGPSKSKKSSTLT